MSFPIRARLTAWYAVLLAAIVIALSTFLVLKLKDDLEDTINREVRDASAQIARGYAKEGPEDFRDVSRTVLPAGAAAAQVLGPDRRVLVAYGDLLAERPIAPEAAFRDALRGETDLVTVRLGPSDQRFRAQLMPVQRGGRRQVLVVAESLRHVEESVRQVLVLLLIAGPAALAATAVGGWWLARKALRPVERMTSKAQEIGIDRLDERIDVPAAKDELGDLAATLNAMLDRLEQGVEEKHRLVADASHELRTPLAAMRAELDVSLMSDDLPAEAREVLESTREEVNRMSRIVDNLLTLARVDEGRLELLKTRVDLGEAAAAAARPLRPLAAAKNVRLELDAEPEVARADPQRLHQALTNFIENAIKFTDEGGAVRIETWHDNGEVGVTVRDNGPGIPPGDRAHVFDRFYRADPARGREGRGSGLGLAICREIADAHGGRVWVESEEGKGSAFSVALPNPPT
jgi:heavy metal sensor kinase